MKILMVCLGNICRSPLAEGILRKKLKEADMDSEIAVDSCGTGDWHAGESPDKRSQANALENGVDISMLKGRQILLSDLADFDQVYCMDASNLTNVQSLATTDEEMNKISLLLNEISPGQNQPVPDPYFGGEEGFQNVFNLVDDACSTIVEGLKK